MTTAKRFFSLLTLSLFALVINLQAQTPASHVSNGQEKAAAKTNEPPTPLAVGPIDGEGTTGKISKFTGANAIGNSILTEKPGKVGVNTEAPTATVHVNGLQPTAVATNGTPANLLLQTTGGKGGNTTGAGKSGGKGASILLVAGDGGNAPADGVNPGSGGDITLQPGVRGTGGSGMGGDAGRVLIAPDDFGRVLIGGHIPFINAKISIYSGDQFDSAIQAFGNGAGIVSTVNNGDGIRGFATVTGTGVYGQSTKGLGVRGVSDSGDGVWGESESNDGVYGESISGIGVFGKATGSGTGVQAIAGTGKGVYGQSGSNSGVYGFSGTGDGVSGSSVSGYAANFFGKGKFSTNLEVGGSESFLGLTFRQMLNLRLTAFGIGVQTSTLYFRTGGGFNWYRGGAHSDAQDNAGGGGFSLMRLDSNGNLFTDGSVNPISDRAAKTNFASVNPRFILDKLAAVPVQTWNYKSEGDAVRHIGPVAQDFKAAFNLGVDDKHISTVDADGVALAAIQGLYQLMLEKEKQNEQLTRIVSQQGSQIEQLRAKLTQLERRAGARAASRPRRRR